MAEYNEVIKQFKRMCNNGHCATATGCTMYPSCNIGQCRRIAFERPFDFEKRVMDWAAEHPEPVYPTFREWLISIGVIDQMSTHSVIAATLAMTPIPADVAERLGVEPKEGR